MASKLIIIEKNLLALSYSGTTLTHVITQHKTYHVNDIYLGKVSSILPSLEAAFVTLDPSSKNGFMHFSNTKYSKKEGLSHRNPLYIKRNDSILVQVIKEPTGTKGPSITEELNVIGKYCAILPFGEGVSITKKLCDEKDKEYLRAMGHLLKPNPMGITISSKSMYADPKFLLKEVKILKNRWRDILRKSTQTTSPCLLSKKKHFITKVLEDLYEQRFDFVSIDSYRGALKIKDIFTTIEKLDNKFIRIEFYENNHKLINRYSLDLVISEIIKPRVNLPQGGHIVIEKTEALTTIDVNSGSFTHLTNAKETILWTNYSAAYETLKQIKLRNIGGIIIIDFIDSNNQEDQMKILLYLSKLMKNDMVSSTIIQISELGLVEITRARQGQNVYDAFSRKCDSCNGLGYNAKKLKINPSKNSEVLLELLPKLSDSTLTKLKLLKN